jgi:hypothetical protein
VPAAAAGRAPNRIRMQLPVGGAIGRGNLPSGTAVSPGE